MKSKLNDEPKFNDVFSRDKLPKTIEKPAYVIDLSEYANIGTHSIALFRRKTEIVYFDSFGIEEINIFRVQASNSIMLDTFSLDSFILCRAVKN